MDRPIRTLKGIGEKTEKLFEKVGVCSTGQLLRYYPRDYDIYERPTPVSEIVPGKKTAVKGRIMHSPGVKKTGAKTIVTVQIQDETGTLSLIWFHMPFLRNILKKGSIYIFRGKITQKNGMNYMEHPEYFTLSAYDQILHSMQPIYGLTTGLTNKTVVKAVSQLLEMETHKEDWLPDKIRAQFHLTDFETAIRSIHFPVSFDDMKLARERLVFDEFLLFILSVRIMKERSGILPPICQLKRVWKTEDIMERLPYELTDAQKNVWFEIERDMQSSRAMARLVQGDVGSGKTIVAFLAMIMAAENGCQAALMAPTEVLAQQHYESLRELLTEEEWEQYDPVLLTGSNTAKEKRQRYEKLKSGKSRLVIGTHALIQEKVEYARLALVITDEQHRFGVRQREQFQEKGGRPHILVMSATPIPRTLAVILYGDLDVSVIDELPAKRLPIKNCVVDQNYRKTAYHFIKNQVNEGRQVYIICPLVEQSEGIDGENVVDYEKKLQILWNREIRTGILHGRMKPADKQEVMQKFAENEIQVLVSTTVVEVGVNVPNATVMMVENAERFGLAQLHQLRGRVGRGEYQSYCIFMYGEGDEHTVKRLEILNHSNDGFHIAQEDMRLRGPGDLLGIRQSGDMEFQLADIYQDGDILKAAAKAADMVMMDFNAPEFSGIKNHLECYLQNKSEVIQL